MIHSFQSSRRVAYVGGALLATLGLLLAWWLLRSRLEGYALLLVPALTAFVAASGAVYAARLVATKECNALLLYLYEDLDPRKFIDAILPLLARTLTPSCRHTLMVHLANGYLYAGDFKEALNLLTRIEAPVQALEMQGQVVGNEAACHIMQREFKLARGCMEELKRIAGQQTCKRELSLKLRRTVAYLQYCLDIQQGKPVPLPPLEADFTTCHAPLHKLDVAYRIALLTLKTGDREKAAQYRNYVVQHGEKTALPALINL